MRTIFLLNRFSLKNKLDKTKMAIEEVCKEKGLDYAIEVNSEEVSTEDIIKKYSKEKVILMAVGGDGTINRVLNEMVGSKNILGFIPNGTGNDFQKTAKELLTKGINYLDLIEINDKYFMNVACFGIDADIGNNDSFIHSKIIPEKQRYNMGIVYHFLNYKPRHMTIKVNKKTYDGDVMTIAVCNSRYYGGGYKVGYTSSPMDGKLEVYKMDKMSKLSMIKLTKGMNKGVHEKSKYTTKITCKELTIECADEIEANVDGEKMKSKIFHIKLIPKGVRIYYDPDLIQRINEKISKLK